ncbi:MAG: hypothetical protein HXY34_03770 [Candidatus Thorarchaeota archaeon]|nr:hypothetical protein [Candidatus Thorarchaeota archaeon]
MKRAHTLVLILGLTMLLTMQMSVVFHGLGSSTVTGGSEVLVPPAVQPDSSSRRPVPETTLYRYTLSDQGMTAWTGYTSPLQGGEYGNATDSFSDLSMTYTPGSGTSGVSANIPTGSGWQGYRVEAQVSGLTENRTWVQNPDLSTAPSSSDWTLAVTNVAGSSTPTSVYNSTGHGSSDGCVDLEIDSTSGSAPYHYDDGDRAYLTQTMTIPRGTVVWAGFKTDYWADTRDDTHYGMTGSFALYLSITTAGQTTTPWLLVFDSIGQEETWYNTGMVWLSPSLFNLPTDQSVTVTIGLWSKAAVGYTPEIGPRAKIDNFEMYLKAAATPASVNLKMNGLNVTSGSGYGSGSLTQTPATPWSVNPIPLNFSWTPTPSPPVPDRPIGVEFDLVTNMYARHLGVDTVYEISPTAYGERFIVYNGTATNFSSYYYAVIPSGYPNRYFFNLSIPQDRDVFFVALPLAPSTNLTYGWTGGNTGDEFLNVSAYQVTTEAGRYGYWRILSTSPNLISNFQMYDPSDSTWKSTVNLRAGNTTRARAYLGPSYQNAIVNFTIYSPSGSEWLTLSATTDSSGYATTNTFTLSGSTAPAGSWMVQAVANDVGVSGEWTRAGFFKRPFTVTHSSELVITYPDDAEGTWVTNTTYGDLVLVILEANDTDSDVLVGGGVLQMSWVLGTDTFDDSGNGQYTKVIDTSLLSGAGVYVISLTWTRAHFDVALATLTIYVNYAATIESPEYPQVSGPIDASQSFTVVFKNVNGTGITGATVAVNWTTYSVTPLGSGSYLVELNCVGKPLGRYALNVTARAPFVIPQWMTMFVEIREIYNTISYSSNQLSIPVGESASFTLTWTNESSLPVTGGASFITCNWSSFHHTGQQNYTVTEETSGVYRITLYTYDTDPLSSPGTPYPVRFEVRRPSYLNHTFDIGVIIRSHNTLFELDAPVAQTPYGQTVVVLVFFQDTDLSVGITNDTGNVEITVSSPTLGTLAYSVGASSFGSGHYNITLASDQWGTIGWKDITIRIRWTGTVVKYYNQTINTSFRVQGTSTDLRLEQSPTATYYLNEFNFTMYYYDMENGTRISNSSGHITVVITPLTGGHPVTQSDFVWNEIGTSGTFSFRLNSSEFGVTGTFSFRFDFSWAQGVSPLYENDSIVVTLVVLDRPTYVDFTPVQATPYGETAVFEFTFVDSLSAERIADSGYLVVSLNEAYVSFVKTYDAGQRVFRLNISTSSLGGVGSFILHLNLTWTGPPYYSSVTAQGFTVIVILRASQLVHDPFIPAQWGNNVTIFFNYTDVVSGSSQGLTGTLTIGPGLSGWYSVTFLGNGRWSLVLNTSAFASDGIYSVNASVVYTGSNYVSDAFELFSISVLKRLTQTGYESPDPAPYLANVTFTVTYVDDSTGTGISGATALVSCTNSSFPLVLDTNYWVSYLGYGVYQVRVSTVALGSVAAYTLSVTLSRSGAPFYQPGGVTVNARVVQRPTQILMVQTPGETPFLENVTFRFKYTDFLTGTLIIIQKVHISLSHGPSMSPITSSQYALYLMGTYYEISFNCTLLNSSALVTGWDIQLSIDRSSTSPFYAARSTVTKATTVERPTLIAFPLVSATPFTENITIVLNYVDYLTGTGIPSASLSIQCANLTSPTYYVRELGLGDYELRVPTQQFNALGIVYFDVTFSRTGVPFYANRTTEDVPATIRAILTAMLVETPPLGVLPPGAPQVVNVTLTDTDHGTPVTGASVTSNWANGYSVMEVGGGLYRLTLNTTGLLAQKYVFTVQAQRQFYQTSSVEASVQPGSQDVQILLERSAYYAEWGEFVLIRFEVRQVSDGTRVPGMNATILWNGSLYHLSDWGNGTYSILLDTSDADHGLYQPQVTVAREYYQTRQTQFSLVVSRASGQIIPGQSSYSVVTTTTLSFVVYLNDTLRGIPVVADSVSFEWNNTAYAMVANGTPGFYVGQIDSMGFPIGSYDVVVTAFDTNHDFLSLEISVSIVPVPTLVGLASHEQTIIVFYGDPLVLNVEYNDTYFGGRLAGANVSFTIGSLAGVLTEQMGALYTGSIDTSLIGAQEIQLRLLASKAGYAMASRTIIVTIRSLPTVIVASPLTHAGYTNDTVVYRLYLNDTHNSLPVIGATGLITWDGSAPVLSDLGNGTYTVTLNVDLTFSRTYEIVVRLSLTNYATAQETLLFVLLRTPATVIGPLSVSVPVNDTAAVEFRVVNDITGNAVTNINGLAYWEGLGEELLLPLYNGNYSLSVPGDLPLGVYTVYLTFPTGQYSVSPFSVEVTVRPIRTSFYVENTTIVTTPGTALTLVIRYFDTDHGVGISGMTPIVSFEGENLTYYPDRVQYLEDGYYSLLFLVNGAGEIRLTLTLTREGFDSQQIIFTILSSASAADLLRNTLYSSAAVTAMIVALAAVYYFKYASVPRLIRVINTMLAVLHKGKIPKQPRVQSRHAIIMTIVNDELRPVFIKKSPEEIDPEPIKAIVPEVNELLERLASVTGLGPAEIEAFRADLARMKASERPGFLREVIRQEEARRAEALAKAEGRVPEVTPAGAPLAATPEIIEDLRKKLKRKGIAPEEIEIILEQAMTLSKADLEALLDSLGIDID